MAPSTGDRGTERQRRAEEARRRAAEQARRRRRRALVGGVVAAVAALALVVAVAVTATRGGDETAASPTAPPTDVATSPAADAENPCPIPETQPAEPLQFEAAPEPGSSEAATAVIATSCGEVTVELAGEAAPQAVASFAFLAGEGYFDGTACHRLTTSGIFVLQCGDPTGTGTGSPGYSFGPVENAPADDVYPAGTLAMARQGGDGESMGSQFFLVYEDSTIPSDAAGGYTVFGQVTEGLDIVRSVAEGGAAGGGGDGPPARPITIEGVTTQ